VAISVDLARRLTGSLLLGVVAGLGIALTPIVWSVGTHADPHALHFVFVAAILWLLVRWEAAKRGVGGSVAGRSGGRGAAGAGGHGDPRHSDARRADRLLLAAAALVGLSIGNHSLTFLFGPPILLFVFAVDREVFRRPRLVAACVAAFLIPTVLVRFEMVLRAGWFRAPFVYADPSTWSGFWYVTLGEQFHGWFTDPTTGWSRRISDLVTMAVGQLGPLAPVVVLAFLATAVRRPRYALLSGTALAITCLFNAVYPDGAIDRYYIGPVLICWTWLAILGSAVIDLVVRRPWTADPDDRTVIVGWRPRLTDRWRSLGLAIVAAVLIAPSVLAVPVRAQVVDRSRDRLAERWTDEVLSAVEPNAVIVSWWSYSTPLWYATIVDQRRTDISIIDDRTRLDCNLGELDHVIDLYLPNHPVYLIRNGTSELPALERRFELVPLGGSLTSNVLRAVPRDPASVPAAGPAVEPPMCPAIQG
jgi:4-amino-4-deoxy-L-arabinose transferase-like glycosyltransferase